MSLSSFLSSLSVFPVLLTVSAFLVAVWIQKKTGWGFLSPIILAAATVYLVLKIVGMPVAEYTVGISFLSYLLTPATICLGLSLYDQLQKLKQELPVLLAGILAGTASALLVTGLLCVLFRLSGTLSVSLLPKNVTTAIGSVLSEENGGSASLTVAAIILTGNLGYLLGPPLSRLFRLKDPLARGTAYGTAAHVIGTSRAMEDDPLAGAAGSLSL
ncbi:MAG: LrgB family protein, partial [Clostridiales bacterium]|nr:LrgB family protein [Clostridiales bacterium]